MPNVALIAERNTRIAALTAVVDGYPDTEHRLGVRTGGAELEDGTRITDHAVALEERLRLTGRVSNISDATGSKPRRAMETIRRLRLELEPFTVLTEWGTYNEMLIDRFDAGYAGTGMRFTMELKQIQRVGVGGTALAPDTVSGPASERTGEITRGRAALGIPTPEFLGSKLEDELHEIAMPSPGALDSLPDYIKGPVLDELGNLERALFAQYSSLNNLPIREGDELKREYASRVREAFDHLPSGLQAYTQRDEQTIGSRVQSVISSFISG